MSLQVCQCACHLTTGISDSWCTSCASMHAQTATFVVNSTIDYNSSIYSTLNEIRSILTDIKNLLEKKSNGRGTKSRKTNRSKT